MASRQNHFRIDQYNISKAFDSLDARSGITQEEMAELEFLYIEVLADSKHGIPNLEYMFGESPILFVQAVAFTYKRNDEKEDSPEWTIKDPRPASINRFENPSCSRSNRTDPWYRKERGNQCSAARKVD